MTDSILENYSKKELDAYNQALDMVLELIEIHKKAYTNHPENDMKKVALIWLAKEIKDAYV